MKQARHVAVTPSAGEIDRIRTYAVQQQIPLESVVFVAEASEHYLPRFMDKKGDLDLVLLDGKHAFPWPMVDWFYTADRLRLGGLMVLDDVPMRSVGVLAEFMKADAGWKVVESFSERTLAFEKLKHPVLDVAWHMQSWTAAPYAKRGIVARVARKVRTMFR